MGVKKNKGILRVYLVLALGFLLFSAGSTNLFTKVVILKWGIPTSAQVLNSSKREFSTAHFPSLLGQSLVAYEPYVKIKYNDRNGESHILDMKIPKNGFRRYGDADYIDIIYNPRFPDYSVKFADRVKQSTWGPDIFLTMSGLITIIGGIYYACRNHVSISA